MTDGIRIRGGLTWADRQKCGEERGCWMVSSQSRRVLLVAIGMVVMAAECQGFVVQPFSPWVAPVNHAVPDLVSGGVNAGRRKQDVTGQMRRRSRQRLSALPNVDDLIYAAQSSASSLASSTMSGSGGSGPSLSSLAVLYFAGLLTSFSPCSLGLLPLTVSYISNAAGEREDKAAFFPALAFAAGLAAVFCSLGLSVALLGGVFGQQGGGGGTENLWSTIALACLSSGVSITMGLQLLDLINIPLPSFEFQLPFETATQSGETGPSSSALLFDDDGNIVQPAPELTAREPTKGYGMALFRTFLLGGSSALVASPCATPVLTSILAFVAASRNPTLGAALLVTYTIGYSTPLLVVGATGGEALAKVQAQSEDGSLAGTIGKLVTPLTAAVLIWYGTTGFLQSVFGDPSLSGLAPILE